MYIYVCVCVYIPIDIDIDIYIYIHIYIYKVFKEKTKIFIKNVLATAFTKSLLSTSNFSVMIHFKTNLQVIIYIIYINEPLNFYKDISL